MVDCDNFIVPDTLVSLHKVRDLGVISPMLVSDDNYSNFHYKVNDVGYYLDSLEYYKILTRDIIGIIQVDVVHCVYYINKSYLNKISYSDNSNRHEYVIFSDSLRKYGIPQYIDNRIFYGIVILKSGITPEELNNYLIKTEKKRIIQTKNNIKKY